MTNFNLKSLAIFLLLCGKVLAADGDIDPTFAPIAFGPATDGDSAANPQPEVDALALAAAGTVYSSGRDQIISGLYRKSLNSFSSKGALNTKFNPTVIADQDGSARSDDIAVAADGKILTVDSDGIVRRYLTSGKLDPAFKQVLRLYNSQSFRIAIAPDMKIIVSSTYAYGPSWTDDYDNLYTGIIRLLADGSIDPGFTPRVVQTDYDNDSGSFIRGISVASDCSIWFCGRLIMDDGAYDRAWGRLDSTGQPDYSVGEDYNTLDSVQAIAVMCNSNVLIARLNYNDDSPNPGYPYIDQIRPDGTPELRWQPLTLPGSDSIYGLNDEKFGWGSQNFNRLIAQADGKILVAGSFVYNSGSGVRHHLARLNSNGTIDSSFAGYCGANGWVRDIKLQPDGRIFAAGSFDIVNGNARKCLVRLTNGPGSGWGTNADPPTNGPRITTSSKTASSKQPVSIQFLTGWYYVTSFAFNDRFTFNESNGFLYLQAGLNSARVTEIRSPAFDTAFTDEKVNEIGTGSTYAPSAASLNSAANEVAKGNLNSFPTLIWAPGTILRTTIPGSDSIGFKTEGRLAVFTNALSDMGNGYYAPAITLVPGGPYKSIPGTSLGTGSNIGMMYSGFYPGTQTPYKNVPRVIQYVTAKKNGISYYIGLFFINTPEDGAILTDVDMPSTDTTAPKVVIKYMPVKNQPVHSDALAIAGDATDNDWIKRVEWQVNGGEWHPCAGQGYWSALIYGLVPGANTVDVRCTDAAGNQGRLTKKLLINRL